jgi:hypothetical protein
MNANNNTAVRISQPVTGENFKKSFIGGSLEIFLIRVKENNKITSHNEKTKLFPPEACENFVLIHLLHAESDNAINADMY